MKAVHTTEAAPAIGPYSQAIQVGNFLYTSGQVPLTAAGEIVSDDVQEQTHQVIKNITAILTAAGTSLDKIVKTTIFIKDMNHFQAINEVYGGYFQEHKPARSTVEVSRLPKDVLIEIEAIAIVE